MTVPAAGSAQAPAAAIATAPVRGPVRWALGLFAFAVVALFAAFTVASIPDAWFPAAGVRTIAPRDLALTRGTGALDRAALVVAAADGTGMALVTANTDFRSADYPVVAWEGSHFADNADVRFLWRTDVAPGKLNTIAVPVVAGRLLPVTMAGNPDWIGRVTGIALVVRGPLARPVRIEGVSAKPGGLVGQAADRLRVEGIAAGVRYEGDPWDMIFHGQPDPYIPTQALPLITVPTLAATGSEMNCAAVITNEETKEKSFVQAECLYPKVALLDPAVAEALERVGELREGRVHALERVLEEG